MSTLERAALAPIPAEIAISPKALQAQVSSSLDAIHRDLISARSLLVGLFYLLFALINYTTMLDENRLSTTLLAVSVTIVFFMFSAFHKFKDYAATYPNHLSFVELGILQADGRHS